MRPINYQHWSISIPLTNIYLKTRLIINTVHNSFVKINTKNSITKFSSRSAVVRGRVITLLGTGLVGVRVSTDTPLEGFTLTREDGWFDLLVNGGGAVTLNFGRAPFKRATKVVYVPWNEVSCYYILI